MKVKPLGLQHVAINTIVVDRDIPMLCHPQCPFLCRDSNGDHETRIICTLQDDRTPLETSEYSGRYRRNEYCQNGTSTW